MKKEAKTYAAEFSSSEKDIQKLTEVFQDISGIGESISPHPKFKKRLEKRLDSLMHVQAMKYQVQERRLYLFAGAFASFLFLGIFLYYMSSNVFVNPFSGTTNTLQAPYISEKPSIQKDLSDTPKEIIDVSTKTTPAPFYNESEWNNSDILPQRSLSLPETDDADVQEEIDEENTGGEKERGIFQKEDTIKTVQENVSLTDEGDDYTKSDGEIAEKYFSDEASLQNIHFEAKQGFSDDALIENTAIGQDTLHTPIQQTFREYCIDVSGIYVNYGITPECHKKGFVCSEEEYYSTGSCFPNLEIQEFIDEYTEE